MSVLYRVKTKDLYDCLQNDSEICVFTFYVYTRYATLCIVLYTHFHKQIIPICYGTAKIIIAVKFLR